MFGSEKQVTHLIGAFLAFVLVATGTFLVLSPHVDGADGVNDADYPIYGAMDDGVEGVFEPVYGANVTYDEYDRSFTIDMRVGDSFSYTPRTNLDGTTIGATGTAMTNGLRFSSGTLSGDFDDAGTYSVTLTATWSDDGLTQHAYQRLTFNVYDRIQFSGSSVAGDYEIHDGFSPTEITSGKVVVTASLTSGLHTPTVSVGSATVDGKSGVFSWVLSTQSLVAQKNLTTSDVGTYTVEIPYTYTSSGGATDSATLTIVIIISEDLVITSSPTFSTYIGSGIDTYNITTNYIDQSDLVFSATASSPYNALISVSGNVLSIDLDAADSYVSSSQPLVFTVNIGVYDRNNVESQDSMALTVTINPSLEYVTVPSIDNVQVRSTEDYQSVEASVTAVGADSVRFEWGDGGSYNTTSGSAGVFSATHDYPDERVYYITITATNDNGESKAYVIYDATDGSWGVVDEPPVDGDDDGSSDSFIDEHGILFIVFAVLAVVFALAFVLGANHPAVIVIAVLMAILAVAAFFTDDFGLELM